MPETMHSECLYFETFGVLVTSELIFIALHGAYDKMFLARHHLRTVLRVKNILVMQFLMVIEKDID